MGNNKMQMVILHLFKLIGRNALLKRKQIFVFNSVTAVERLEVCCYCIIFIDKHCSFFATANCFNFIVYFFVGFPYMGVIHKVNPGAMCSLLFIAVPINGIANFESWGCSHIMN